MKKIIFLFLFSFIIADAFSQVERYKLKHEGEGVKVYYRWKEKVFIFPTGKKTLELHLANQNDYRVSVSFVIDVYKNAILHASTDSLRYCMPPNYEISGRFRHLEFEAEEIIGPGGDEDQDENGAIVSWEINNYSVIKDEDCETRANWR